VIGRQEWTRKRWIALCKNSHLVSVKHPFGTDKMCKITNVYRPWDGGTDKLGERSWELGASSGEKDCSKLHAPGSRLLAPRASRVSRVGHGLCHGSMIKKGPFSLICHGCHGLPGRWKLQIPGANPDAVYRGREISNPELQRRWSEATRLRTFIQSLEPGFAG
jgi:hypothetical protein